MLQCSLPVDENETKPQKSDSFRTLTEAATPETHLLLVRVGRNSQFQFFWVNLVSSQFFHINVVLPVFWIEAWGDFGIFSWEGRVPSPASHL